MGWDEWIGFGVTCGIEFGTCALWQLLW